MISPPPPWPPISAVPWGESFALFIADPGGSIYAIKALPGYGWEVVPGRNSKPDAPVTAIRSGNRFTLFMADVNGEIFTTSGVPYQGWDSWTSVSEGSSAPGAPVAAVPWGDSFALFIRRSRRQYLRDQGSAWLWLGSST